MPRPRVGRLVGVDVDGGGDGRIFLEACPREPRVHNVVADGLIDLRQDATPSVNANTRQPDEDRDWHNALVSTADLQSRRRVCRNSLDGSVTAIGRRLLGEYKVGAPRRVIRSM